MKRSQINENVNRSKNTLYYNRFNRNIVYPTILFNPVMLSKDESSTGIEIIEIKSDEEHNTQENKLNTQDISCKSNFNDDFVINGSVRERGCLRQEQMYDSKSNIVSEAAFSQACTDFYGIDCHDRGDRIPSMFPFGNDSTSTETFSDYVEEFELDNALNDICWNSDDSYNSHIKSYIYNKKFVKPRQYLFESNYPNNIPSLETSYSSFTDDDEPREDFIRNRTMATPIPTYVPRLNLLSSPTLATVTEVTELNKSSLNITESSRTDTQYTKPVNTWFFTDKNIETTPNRTINYKNNLITLSQREKRRMKLKEIQDQVVVDLKEDGTRHCDSKIVLHAETHTPKLQENSEEMNKIKEIANETEMNIENSLQKPQIDSPKLLQTKNHVSDVIEKMEGNWIGNGRNNVGQENIEVFDFDLDTSNVEKSESNIKETMNQNNNQSVTNMSERKRSSELTQYSADANSIPSLQLSFGTDYESEEISWFKRIFMFVRCCK